MTLSRRLSNQFRRAGHWLRRAEREREPHLLEASQPINVEVGHEANSSVAAKCTQLLLACEHARAAQAGCALKNLNEVEFRAFSQNGEDGILLYIFSLIGSQSRIVVEACAGNGIQCNAANLNINHGWRACLLDGNEKRVQEGIDFYSRHPDTFSYPPTFIHAWITSENINSLIESAGFSDEIDLLSIDLDGVDLWIWEAITCISPRVVVVEIQCIWPAEYCVTVPYSADFESPLVEGFGIYSGASPAAFSKLAKKKGYRLVGTQSLGFNAFFVRDDIPNSLLPERTIQECLDRPFVHWASNRFLPLVKDRQWEVY